MSVEPNPSFLPYTVSILGPYPIAWPYGAGSVTAAVVLAGQRIQLIPGTDFSVTPAASSTGGALALSAGALAAYAGCPLYIGRSTITQQGWIGVAGQREAGLEAQLDIMTMRLQEIDHYQSGILRLETPAPPFVAVPGAVVAFNQNGYPVSGPLVTQIASAQSDAAAAHADRLAADQAAADADASAQAAAASAANANVRLNANQTFTGQNSFGQGISIPADKAVAFGATPEVEALYSTSGDKFILRALNGLKATMASLRFDGFELVDRLNVKSFIRCLPGAEVWLGYNGTKKLETDAAGVIVTGRLKETDRAVERWHSVSRTAATWYQNTTGRMIRVAATAESSNTAGTISLHVNDAPSSNQVSFGTTPAIGIGNRATVNADVPPNHYYFISVSGGASLYFVQELS